MKNGQFLSNFNFRLICQLCLFIICTEHFNVWIAFFSWKPCKFELPFYGLACSVGVGVKFVFSIEGVGCEVTGLQYRSLDQVILRHKQDNLVTYIKITVTN